MTNIGKIKQLAKEKGIKLSFICDKLDLAKVYFNDVEKNNRTIPFDRLGMIAEILDTTPEYLNDETEQKEKPTVDDNGLNDLLKGDYMEDIYEAVKALPPEIRKVALAQIQALKGYGDNSNK